ncbi:PQQ-binding-like beta-propeller repeat protein [Nocardia sp. PE-7]|uniref:outer membrane protein assembly factor BamB family protein n=1 Tax=Nocardia sp. PE-7 TaxID=3058426 RepID=UPI002658320C|nr:PQQ-binding-like beta-propeller repeat protein [Nocardia sp. PE-7]WKG08097.1 PQQ-binding-like beta-propeller repeat protein [Nocardia sp. PE-7]
MNNSRTTSLPRLPDYSRLATITAALGTAILIGGVALGLFSRFLAAANPVTPGDDARAELPDALGMSAIVVGVVALLTIAAVLLSAQRLRAAGFGNPGMAIYLVLAVAIVRTMQLHVPSVAEQIFEHYAAFPRLPTAIAAWVLVCLGILVVTYPLTAALRFTPTTRTIAVPATIGLLLCALATGGALWVGDDDRSVDHRTAASVVAPPVPNRLGQERFRIALPKEGRVVVGGPGFIIGTPTGITAYDGATGSARWHYLRPDAAEDGVHQEVSNLLSIPAENAVLTSWKHLGWIAFDATTGEKLWTESDFADDSKTAMRVAHGVGAVGESMLALVDDELFGGSYGNFARYDARTGRHMWSEPATPDGCDDMTSRIAITSPAVYQVQVCRNRESAWTTVLALDPATGAQIARRDLPNPDPDRAPKVSAWEDALLVDWAYRNAPLDHLVVAAPGLLGTAAVTAGYVKVIANDPATGTLVTNSWDTGITLSQGAAPDRSLTDPDARLGGVSPFDAKLITDELIAVGDAQLRTWRRVDLVENTPPVPLGSGQSSQIIAAPGIILIPLDDKSAGQQLIGFAP